jgi:hypothetical protein
VIQKEAMPSPAQLDERSAVFDEGEANPLVELLRTVQVANENFDDELFGRVDGWKHAIPPGFLQ